MQERVDGERGSGVGDSATLPTFQFRAAEVMVPSLDDWEKPWNKNQQGLVKPAVVQVDFRTEETDSPGRTSEQSGVAAKVSGNGRP